MFENQAKECVQKAMSSNLMQSISDKWNREIDDYSIVIKLRLSMNLNSIALKYIDENIPKAWFRDLFK